ncbi:hypothetical protein CVT25_010463 [Psilocybe cyanescens]|uniref:Uncharacterized protein n=1 Tax=Psilocybe cyanescens TaxID=93625 RepID=A0A409XDF9_PSICY|nr:hypothetical protein CVT25_010463 [Psilocybe cyanescens]
MRLLSKDSGDEFVADAPSTSRAALDVKYRRGSGIRVADSSNQSSSRFGPIQLVKDDDEYAATKNDDSDHILTVRAPLLSADSVLRMLEVHEALLATRLKGFLMFQDVSKTARCAVLRWVAWSGQENKRRRMYKVEREMRKIQLEQQQPASITAPSPNDAQIPARPIRSSLPSLSPEPMSVSRSARQRRAVLPTSYMIVQGVRRSWVGLLQWKKGLGRGLSGLRTFPNPPMTYHKASYTLEHTVNPFIHPFSFISSIRHYYDPPA